MTNRIRQIHRILIVCYELCAALRNSIKFRFIFSGCFHHRKSVHVPIMIHSVAVMTIAMVINLPLKIYRYGILNSLEPNLVNSELL